MKFVHQGRRKEGTIVSNLSDLFFKNKYKQKHFFIFKNKNKKNYDT